MEEDRAAAVVLLTSVLLMNLLHLGFVSPKDSKRTYSGLSFCWGVQPEQQHPNHVSSFDKEEAGEGSRSIRVLDNHGIIVK